MLFIDFFLFEKKLKRDLSTYMMRCLIATTHQNRKKHSNFSSKQWLLLDNPP